MWPIFSSQITILLAKFRLLHAYKTNLLFHMQLEILGHPGRSCPCPYKAGGTFTVMTVALTVSPCKSWTRGHCKSSEGPCPFFFLLRESDPSLRGCQREGLSSCRLEVWPHALGHGADSSSLPTRQRCGHYFPQRWFLPIPPPRPHAQCTGTWHCSLSTLKTALQRTDVTWKSHSPGA